jgi:hypothetical protein
MTKIQRTEPFSLGIGGGRRDRTDDPLLAKQVLSQLSYAPRHRLVARLTGTSLCAYRAD